MVGDSRLHCGRYAKRLVDAAEIVVHKMQRHSRFQIIQLLAKSVCQSRESAHRHSHREVLSLYKRHADVLRIGMSSDPLGYRLHEPRWGISAIWAFWKMAVNLNQLHKINVNLPPSSNTDLRHYRLSGSPRTSPSALFGQLCFDQLV